MFVENDLKAYIQRYLQIWGDSPAAKQEKYNIVESIVDMLWRVRMSRPNVSDATESRASRSHQAFLAGIGR